MSQSALSLVFDGLPRAGPGSDATTAKVIRKLPPLGRSPRILDIGCGPGKQTLVLARMFRSAVVAVDVHWPYLDRLAESAADAGLSEFIETRRISMDALDYAPESFDLIWAEGSAYVMGLTRALAAWKPLLRPVGVLAFSELTWLSDDRPSEAAAFWAQNYPAMKTVAGNVNRMLDAGYEQPATFALPPEDWWTEYYGPLQSRIASLRRDHADDPELAAILRQTQDEIEIYERCGDSYGYVFYLAHKLM